MVHGHLVIKWIEQRRQNDVISLEFLINLFLTDDEFYEYLDFILLTALNFPDISHSPFSYPSVTSGTTRRDNQSLMLLKNHKISFKRPPNFQFDHKCQKP